MQDVLTVIMTGAFFLAMFTGMMAITAVAVTVIIGVVKDMLKKK